MAIKRLVVELEESTHQKIKNKALKENTSMREVLTKLLKEWLNKKS